MTWPYLESEERVTRTNRELDSYSVAVMWFFNRVQNLINTFNLLKIRKFNPNLRPLKITDISVPIIRLNLDLLKSSESY